MSSIVNPFKKPLNSVSSVSFISVDSYNFNKSYLSALLSFLDINYEESHLIIADDIIVYNKFDVEDLDRSDLVIKEYTESTYNMVTNIVGANSRSNSITVSKWADFCEASFF